MTEVYDGAATRDRTVLPDQAALMEAVAEWMVAEARAKEGRFALSLSGGSTPRALYELLASPRFRDRMPWARVHLFWGDERMVPPDHADSNYRMVREALLDHVPVPPAQVHPMPTDGDPAAAARRYQAELGAYYGRDVLDPARPLFDVTLLGLGDNGHTASLFPGTPVAGGGARLGGARHHRRAAAASDPDLPGAGQQRHGGLSGLGRRQGRDGGARLGR